ncbi:MAG: hypothetical protein E6I60_09540 [Chloroflexi bacterium]|nr:MAG: hypothetical protein E6I60_09540 [Chloroflexota bacterium]
MVRPQFALAMGSALVLAAGAAASSVPAVAAPGISFGVPVVVDPIHTNGEPDIGIDPQGRVFVSGPTGTGTQRSTWFGSVDQGHTFRVISPGPPPSPLAGLIDPPGGGDTDINFDRSGKQYFADLYALTCLRTATTSDGGATVSQSVYPAGCAGVPGADRQWLAVYDPPTNIPHQSAYAGPTPLIYMAYNNLVGPGPNGGAEWTSSGDGLNYVNATKGVTPATEAVYSPFGPDGYPAIDQQTGKVFQAAGNPNGDGTYDLLLNIGTPDVNGNLTFLDAPPTVTTGWSPANLIHIADNLSGSPDTLFSVLSMDSARNLFVVWCISASDQSNRQVFVSAASAASEWKAWTPPRQVSDASTGTGDAVNVFPWIKAGGAGRADAVWYGSDKNVDPSSQLGQKWNVFMSQVVYPTTATGAVTGAAPSTRLVKVSPHPMHYDDICLQGTGCIQSQGNRNLADFFVVTIDARGAAQIVYDDTSNGLVQPGFTPGNQQLVDHAGAGVITIAQQTAGPGLFGTSISGPSNSPSTGLSDVGGDARYPVIGGTDVPGMDILSSQLSVSSKTLTVTATVADLTNPADMIARVPGAAYLQYVTRWQMGNTIYYAAMENTALKQPTFFAGKAQSVDLCSVSACFPHVITYPEPAFGGVAETGIISCPASPSASNPCTLTITVKMADVGGPTASSLLEEVGGYAFASAHQQGALTNAQAEADNVPLEIDGVCCYNFRAK